MARALVEGAWPLWDPRAGFGQPLLANPNVQVLYPPGWLGLLLPPGLAYTLYVHLHLVWAGLGVRALALRLGRGSQAATFAAALFVVAGPTLSVVNVWHHLGGLAWLPWTLLLADRTLVTPGRRNALAWGGAAAAQLFAGSPDLCLMSHACAAGLVAWRLFERPAARPAAYAALAAAAGAGLGAAQWLPTLDLVVGSARAWMPPGLRLPWSLAPQALAQLALPVRFDAIPELAPAAAVGALAELWNPFLASVHLGPVALALAVAGMGVAGRARWALAALAAAAVGLALGRHTPLYEVSVGLVPGLAGMRYPSKFILLLPLAVALLAAGGIERCCNGSTAAVRWTIGVALALAALLGGSGPISAGVVGAPGWLALWTAEGSGYGALGGGLAAAGAFVATFVPRARATAMAAAALLGSLAFNVAVNSTAPTGFVAQRPGNAAAVRALGERAYVWAYTEPGRLAVPGLPGALLDVPYEPRAQARIQALREYLLPPSAGRWGIDGSYEGDLMGFFDLPQRAAVRAIGEVEGTPAYPRLLQRAGVQSVVALHSHGHVGLLFRGALPGLFRRPVLTYTVSDPLPRAFAVAGVRAVATDVEGLVRLADAAFDPRSEVAIAGAAPRPVAADFTAAVTVVARRADAVEIAARLSHAGHVVLLEAWAPGWRAEVDGVAAPVLRANGIFRAVSVAAGAHRVTLRYRPPAAAAGAGLSLLALAACAVAWRMAPRR